MTGLSSDVDHVTRVLQKHVQDHRGIFDEASLPMPVSGIAKWLAETVRSAAKWNGGRPYGLQALLVGREDSQNLSVYSVDPSGAWRHWGSGCTAIGRNSEDIRQQLHDELQEEPANLNPLRSLKVALKALLLATRAASVNQDNDDYNAVLVWVDPGGSQCRVATVDSRALKACRDEIWEALAAK